MAAPSDPNSMAAAAAAYMMAFAAASGGGTPPGVTQPPAPVLPAPLPVAPSQGPLEMTSNLPVEPVPDAGERVTESRDEGGEWEDDEGEQGVSIGIFTRTFMNTCVACGW